MEVGDLVRHRISERQAVVLGEKIDHWIDGPDAFVPGWTWVRWTDGFVSQVTEGMMEVINKNKV